MILYSTPTSPFGRKVKIAALTLGLRDRIQVEFGDPWTEGSELRKVNPLGKMPAMITPEGKTLFDSGVILEYLDTLIEQPVLFPVARRMDVLVTHALGDGLMDAGILITYERLRRPAEFTYEGWIDHQRGKLERGLSLLVTDAPDPAVIDAGTITIACALGYFDWRQQIDWRNRYPKLVTWLDAFRAACPAFDATKADH